MKNAIIPQPYLLYISIGHLIPQNFLNELFPILKNLPGLWEIPKNARNILNSGTSSNAETLYCRNMVLLSF